MSKHQDLAVTISTSPFTLTLTMIAWGMPDTPHLQSQSKCPKSATSWPNSSSNNKIILINILSWHQSCPQQKADSFFSCTVKVFRETLSARKGWWRWWIKTLRKESRKQSKVSSQWWLLMRRLPVAPLCLMLSVLVNWRTRSLLSVMISLRELIWRRSRRNWSGFVNKLIKIGRMRQWRIRRIRTIIEIW